MSCFIVNLFKGKFKFAKYKVIEENISNNILMFFRVVMSNTIQHKSIISYVYYHK